MNTELNELAGIKNYTVTDLRNSVDVDRHAVRDEAMRRHALVSKRFVKAQKEMSELESVLKLAL